MSRLTKAVKSCAQRALVLGMLLAPAVAQAQEAAPDAAMAEARKQFSAGVNLLDDPDGAKYEEAYHAFRKAYELSKSPKVLGNIGFCALHLERDGEAIDAYTAYLRDAPEIDDRERAQITKDLQTLTSTAARFRLKVKHPAASFVLIDTRSQTRGAPIENSYPIEGNELSIRIRPGRHTFKVKTADAESVPLEATIEPASDSFHEFVFPPPKAAPVATTRVEVRESVSVAGPVILGVTGLVALGAGITTGVLARGKTSDIESSCPNDLCPATFDLDGERDKAKALGTIADVSFIAGGALVGGALLWYVLLPKSKTSSSTKAAWAPGGMCTQQGCAVQLQRSF
jgi:hypothetical protein